jgi:hypothetical protein
LKQKIKLLEQIMEKDSDPVIDLAKEKQIKDLQKQI